MILPEKPKEKEDKGFTVWEDNWECVMLFIRMQTQWQTTMGGFVGLKYDVLLVSGGLFDLYNVKDRRSMLVDLQIMEATALKELNKKSDG